MNVVELSYSIHENGVYVQQRRTGGDDAGEPRTGLLACGPWETIREEAEAVRSTFHELIREAGDSGSAEPSHALGLETERRLRPLATELAHRLVPEVVVRGLEASGAGTPLVFDIDPRLNGLPFEALFVGRDYLGFRFSTVRRVLTRHLGQPRRSGGTRGPLRVGTVFDPGACYDARAAEAFDAFLETWRRETEERRLEFPAEATYLRCGVSRDDLARLLRECDVLAIYAHHEGADGKAGREGRGLRLDTDAYFSPEDLHRCLRPVDVPPEFLVSISCDSACHEGWEKDWLMSDRVHGFVDAAFRTGVGHYLASLYELPSTWAGRMLPPLFRALADGRSVAASVRRARLAQRGDHPHETRHSGTFLGLAFALYAHGPCVRPLVGGDGKRIREGESIGYCAHDEHGEVCGRGITAGMPGYEVRRCPEHASRRDAGDVCDAGHPVAAQAIKVCSAPGCRTRLCPACGPLYQAGRCASHVSWGGRWIPLDGSDASFEVCSDRFRLHAGQTRHLHVGEGAAYALKMCLDCLEHAKVGARRG